MTLAVVMATYNGERYLKDQLDSIASQTRPPERLVISDDGSSDATHDIARKFADNAAFETRLVRGPGRGLAWNFWTAAQLADADLIAWADQDDVWHPSKLQRCEEALRDPTVDFVSHSALTTDAAGNATGRRYPHYRRTQTLEPLRGDPWHVPSGFASMFRSSLLADVDYEHRPRSHQTLRPMNHDHVISLRAFAHSRRAQLADVLAQYRQHAGNAAGDPTPTGISAVRQAIMPCSWEFLSLASVAREHGNFVADGPDDPASAYYRQLEHICQERAQIYGASSLKLRVECLSAAVRHEAYVSRALGGFGARALIRDAVLSLALPIRSGPSRTEDRL